MSKLIDVIAPSGRVEPEVLPQLSAALAQMGFTARIPSNLLGDDLISANSDSVRLILLKQALWAEDSDFVWAIRGGCGATRLLPGLQNLSPPSKKKRLMGFSDITALHLFLTQHWGWETIHGISARQLALPDEVEAESLNLSKALLQDPAFKVSYPLQALNPLATTDLIIKAALTGGNLKLTECSLGTFWQINTQHKILLIEDLNELAYRVDRTLTHLLQAGVFDQVKAVIFGDFTYGARTAEATENNRVIERFANELKIPVWRGPFFGHGKINSPWRYAAAEIRAGTLIQ